VTVAQNSWEISVGDVVVIHADEAQKISNLGNDDLVFLAICSPRFEVENYYEVQSRGSE
jgi:mannose-6-phosphate isomerase-like protein (cupin superfamily)